MELFDQIVDEFSSLSQAKAWPELRELFQRVATGKPRHWLLPLRSCEAVGGNSGQSIPALTAIACAHIGIVLVDDMLDADPRGEHLRAGGPAVANMVSALQSAAPAVIARRDLKAESKLAALEGLNEMFLSTSLGQHWDVQSVTDEDGYWRVTQTKSSPFFGAALQLGALAGGASVELSMRIKDLGCLYGEMIQIHDDLHDSMESPANPDWTEGRFPLPILFASLVNHPLRARFEELRPNAGTSPAALEEAQEILIRCGAVSYCVDQLLERDRSAKELLSALLLNQPAVLIALFDDAIAPVEKLFSAAGEMQVRGR